MKQFCFATKYAAGSTDVAGDINIVGNNLVLRRNPDNGGDILYPIYPKDLSTSISEGTAPVQMVKSFEIPEVQPYLDYTVIFVKKGTGFNERSNWTASVHTTTKDTASTVAAAIAKFVNNNTELLGLTASSNEAVVTVTGPATGENYEIKFGDELYGTKLEDGAKEGKVAYMNAKDVMDLANKCAADAGFEYTYDDFAGLYPNFPFNPLALGEGADKAFFVVNIRFTEPRKVGTREESVYQMIHVVFDSKEKATAFETAVKALK